MKRHVSALLMGLLFMAAAAQNTNRLTLNPQQPTAGTTLQLTYDSKGGPLGGMDNVVGIAYTYENYQWKVYDVDLQNAGNNVWKGSFSLPANSAVVAFKFQHTLSTRPDATDNGDNQGYLYQVRDAKGRLVPGAEVGRVLFLSPSITNVLGYEGVHGYFTEGHAEPAAQELQAAIDAEKKLSKKNANKLFNAERLLLGKIHGRDAARPYVLKLAQGLEKQKNLTEEDLMNLYSTYIFDLDDREKAKQLEEVMLQKYPYGRTARRVKLQIPFSVKGEEYFALTRQLRKDFPVSKFYENPDQQGFIFSNFYRRLAQELFDNKKYDELAEVLKEMNSGMLVDAYLHQPKQWLKFADRDPNGYYDIAKKYIEEMTRKVDFQGNLSGTEKTPKQSAERCLLDLGFYRTVQTELARRTGHYQEGIDCMDAIPEKMRFNYPPEGNEAYIRCLEALGRTDDALKAATASAANGKMTPYIMEILKNHYDALAEKPGANFNDYLYSLKTDEAKAETLQHVKEGLVSDNYTPFDVEDFNGGRVNSADFAADDIIVLDFWAPWCAPCCAALVGMQMAVDKYINDPKVKFYFVDTQDKTTADVIHQYWKEKGYHDMLVVFDQNRDEYPNGHDKLYSDMFPGTSGIPQKAILKGGKIRYRASGYMGSPSGLMDEISAVIELLKSE